MKNQHHAYPDPFLMGLDESSPDQFIDEVLGLCEAPGDKIQDRPETPETVHEALPPLSKMIERARRRMKRVWVRKADIRAEMPDHVTDKDFEAYWDSRKQGNRYHRAYEFGHDGEDEIVSAGRRKSQGEEQATPPPSRKTVDDVLREFEDAPSLDGFDAAFQNPSMESFMAGFEREVNDDFTHPDDLLPESTSSRAAVMRDGGMSLDETYFEDLPVVLGTPDMPSMTAPLRKSDRMQNPFVADLHYRKGDSTKRAEQLGHDAFKRGDKRIPANDDELDKLITDIKPPESTAVIKAWLHGWDAENLKSEDVSHRKQSIAINHVYHQGASFDYIPHSSNDLSSGVIGRVSAGTDIAVASVHDGRVDWGDYDNEDVPRDVQRKIEQELKKMKVIGQGRPNRVREDRTAVMQSGYVIEKFEGIVYDIATKKHGVRPTPRVIRSGKTIYADLKDPKIADEVLRAVEQFKNSYVSAGIEDDETTVAVRLTTANDLREDRLDEDLTMGGGDKKVLMAFLDQKAASSKKLDTDGERLDGLWMGGKGIASWKNGKIHLRDATSRSEQTVLRFLVKNGAKNDFAPEVQKTYASWFGSLRENAAHDEMEQDTAHDRSKVLVKLTFKDTKAEDDFLAKTRYGKKIAEWNHKLLTDYGREEGGKFTMSAVDANGAKRVLNWLMNTEGYFWLIKSVEIIEDNKVTKHDPKEFKHRHLREGHHYKANEWPQFFVSMEGESSEYPRWQNPDNDGITPALKREAKTFADAVHKALDKYFKNNAEELADGHSVDELKGDDFVSDVLLTLEGHGAGIWDGDWDVFFAGGNAGVEKLQKFLEHELRTAHDKIMDAIRDAAYETMGGEEMDGRLREAKLTHPDAESNDNVAKSLEIANDKKKLMDRFRYTISVMEPEVRELFGKGATLDFEGKRLIGTDGKTFLQFLVREKPQRPIGGNNQQTSRGTVVILSLKDGADFKNLTRQFQDRGLLQLEDAYALSNADEAGFAARLTKEFRGIAKTTGADDKTIAKATREFAKLALDSFSNLDLFGSLDEYQEAIRSLIFDTVGEAGSLLAVMGDPKQAFGNPIIQKYLHEFERKYGTRENPKETYLQKVIGEYDSLREGLNEDQKPPHVFKVGDVVWHKKEFLRNIGWYTDVPDRGKVVAVQDMKGGKGKQYVKVQWLDHGGKPFYEEDEPKGVLSTNIELHPRFGGRATADRLRESVILDEATGITPEVQALFEKVHKDNPRLLKARRWTYKGLKKWYPGAGGPEDDGSSSKFDNYHMTSSKILHALDELSAQVFTKAEKKKGIFTEAELDAAVQKILKKQNLINNEGSIYGSFMEYIKLLIPALKKEFEGRQTLRESELPPDIFTEETVIEPDAFVEKLERELKKLDPKADQPFKPIVGYHIDLPTLELAVEFSPEDICILRGIGERPYQGKNVLSVTNTGANKKFGLSPRDNSVYAERKRLGIFTDQLVQKIVGLVKAQIVSESSLDEGQTVPSSELAKFKLTYQNEVPKVPGWWVRVDDLTADGYPDNGAVAEKSISSQVFTWRRLLSGQVAWANGSYTKHVPPAVEAHVRALARSRGIKPLPEDREVAEAVVEAMSRAYLGHPLDEVSGKPLAKKRDWLGWGDATKNIEVLRNAVDDSDDPQDWRKAAMRFDLPDGVWGSGTVVANKMDPLLDRIITTARSATVPGGTSIDAIKETKHNIIKVLDALLKKAREFAARPELVTVESTGVMGVTDPKIIGPAISAYQHVMTAHGYRVASSSPLTFDGTFDAGKTSYQVHINLFLNGFVTELPEGPAGGPLLTLDVERDRAGMYGYNGYTQKWYTQGGYRLSPEERKDMKKLEAFAAKLDRELAKAANLEESAISRRRRTIDETAGGADTRHARELRERMAGRRTSVLDYLEE